MIELDFTFDLPDFDGLLDDLDLDVSLDGIDLDLDLDLSDDPASNREGTEREQRENHLLKIVEFSTGIARTPANPIPQKRSFWSP
jgi:hypothetical protein